MSYDLMVFAPEAAPQDRAAFMQWYEQQTQWTEAHNYDDPAVCTPALRAWFLELIQSYATLNGPYATKAPPDDPAPVADYSLGQALIYTAFTWREADHAYQTTFNLAAKHGVGLFNASSDNSEVWLPDREGGKGGLVLAHAKPRPWWRGWLGKR